MAMPTKSIAISYSIKTLYYVLNTDKLANNMVNNVINNIINNNVKTMTINSLLQLPEKVLAINKPVIQYSQITLQVLLCCYINTLFLPALWKDAAQTY